MAQGPSEAPTAKAPLVFISYSPGDAKFIEPLYVSLKSAEKSGLISVWDDRLISPGAAWDHEINRAIERARVAVLLISPDYLASEWVTVRETPRLLERQKRGDLRIVPILLRPCNWQEIDWLRELQLFPHDGEPIAGRTESMRDKLFNEVAGHIVRLAIEQSGPLPTPPEATPDQQPPPLTESTGNVAPAPTDPLSPFKFSPEARAILQRARLLATFAREQPPEVTTPCLLFAIAEGGRDTSRIMRTPEFLWKELNADGGELYRKAFELEFPHARYSSTDATIDFDVTVEEIELFSRNALSIFHLASEISSKTRKPPEASSSERTETGFQLGRISARHLLAALLLLKPETGLIGAMSRFTLLGIDEMQLREKFFGFIVQALPEDDPQAWRTILELEEEGEIPEQEAETEPAHDSVSTPDAMGRASLAGFLTDYWYGEDLLDITPDVNALASLVAAWSVEPPLSIGLFGDWGSGKSHFMRQLKARVEVLSRSARKSNKPQNKIGYYKNIVQIEFNAWHYIEGNLWASLVEHIFAHLKLSDKEKITETEARRDALMEKLGVKKQIQARVNERKEQLKGEETKARERAASAKTTRDNLLLLLRDELKSSVLDDTDFEIKFTTEQKDLLKRLGIPGENLASAAAIHKTYLESKSLWQRFKAECNLFYNEPTSLRKLGVSLAVFLIPMLVAIILPLVYQALTTRAFSKLYAWLASGLTFLLTFLAAAKPYWTQLQKGLNTLKEKHDEIERERRRHIIELQSEVNVLTQRYKDAENEADTIKQQVKELETEIAGTTASKILADFIEDRAAASDYRRHLGVLAIIRRDFEKLATLFSEQREEERKGNGAQDERTINRIILYIDDLDRCPPDRVVQVLQAIHLLLAFPLFVVVVGVDARWVTRSLKESYEWLRIEEEEEEEGKKNDRSATNKTRGATPHDYLEKIFQIPFWLKPMEDEACKIFLDGLTKDNLESADTNGNASRTTEDGRQAEEQKAGDAKVDNLERQPTQKAPASVSSPHVNESNVTGQQQQTAGAIPPTLGSDSAADAQRTVASLSVSAAELEELERAARERFDAEKTVGAGADKDEEQAKDEMEEIDLEPLSLKISKAEVAYMKKLTPLIRRSPRAVKRFLNCYRLIKVGLLPAQLSKFIGKNGQGGEYKAVMILLGIITGAPTVSLYFIEELEKWPKSGKAGSLHDFLGQLQKNPEVSQQPDWTRVKELLDRHVRQEDSVETLKTLIVVAPRVSRFSFRVARVETARQKKAPLTDKKTSVTPEKSQVKA